VAAVPGLWVFAPNPRTQGGTAWWLTGDAADTGLLIDCPAFTRANLNFLRHQGAGTLVLTGRHGHGDVRRWQQALGWSVLVQEQEAYLLPRVERLECFAQEHRLAAGAALLWAPGPSPGAVVLLSAAGARRDGVLFCGRLLLPVAPAVLAPLRRTGTFHWPRQLRSLANLRQWLAASGAASPWLASGGGLGALRGGKVVPDGLAQLAALDLEALLEAPAGDVLA
jgi:hypothetical protein